jgi:glycosyltransferase involved in cell wall biosynthesis
MFYMHSGTEQKNILFISHDATRTGAPIALLNIARALENSKAGKYKFSFLINRHPYEILEKFAEYPLRLATANYYSIRKKLKLSTYSAQRIKASLKDVDLVISNTITNGDILPTIRKYFSGPIYSYVHELEMSANYFSNENDVNALLACTNRFLVPALAVKNFLEARYKIGADKIDLLQCYVPPVKREITREEKKDVMVIGSVGTIDWRKSPDLFVQVARATFQEKPYAAIKFLWKGAIDTVELARLKYDVVKAGLENKLEFLASSNDMQSFYNNIDVLLLTSREDPYPLVVLEAADAGAPTICFEKAGGAPEFVRTANAGICVDYLDTAAMAKAVIFYYENKDRRIADGKASRSFVLQTHQSSDYISNQFEAIINIPA